MEFPLRYTSGHIIATIGKEDWLVDTGSPASFGDTELTLDGVARKLPAGFMGIGGGFLREHTDIPLSGLLGTDVLNTYEVVFDLPKGVIRLGQEIEVLPGREIPIVLCLGVPVLNARINGESMSCFFDTGAQVSYAPPQILKPEDLIGTFQDFYPTQGSFETDLHWADLELGDSSFRIRCGTLPDFLAGLMNMGGAQCIIGNEVLPEHRIGYFPRHGVLVIR